MKPILPTRAENNPPRRATGWAGNERGSALILAIIMLVIFSVLGSVVLMSSDTEMKVTRNYQVAKQTFWVADRAVEYATSRNILMNMGTQVDFVPPVCDPADPAYDLTDPACVHKARIETGGGGVLMAGTVTDLGAGGLPTKLAGLYGSDFGGNYYQVSVTAQQSAAANSAAVRVDTTIVRIFKNDDESVFITTGGG